MFQDQYFYNKSLRKLVVGFGSLFSNIYVEHPNQNDLVNTQIKVPITYAAKDKMLARVLQDPSLDKTAAVPAMPMISFEMGKMEYDGTRKLNTIGRIAVKDADDVSKFKYQYNPVPYNIQFKAYIYVKNVEDGTKIVEQILPYFTPDWTTTCNLIPEMEIKMDIPIILTNINYSDKYDGDYKDRRMIIWELDFVCKGYFYGPVKKGGIIKFINLDFFIPKTQDIADGIGVTPMAEKVTIQPGLDANGNPINYYGQSNSELGTLPYNDIEVDDDYGFITMVYNTDEIE